MSDSSPLRFCRLTFSPWDFVDWLLSLWLYCRFISTEFMAVLQVHQYWIYGCTAVERVREREVKERERERERKWEREREREREAQKEPIEYCIVCKWDITFKNLRTWVFGLILDISGRPHLEFILSERNVVLPKTNSGDSASKNRNSPLRRSLWRNR